MCHNEAIDVTAVSLQETGGSHCEVLRQVIQPIGAKGHIPNASDKANLLPAPETAVYESDMDPHGLRGIFEARRDHQPSPDTQRVPLIAVTGSPAGNGTGVPRIDRIEQTHRLPVREQPANLGFDHPCHDSISTTSR